MNDRSVLIERNSRVFGVLFKISSNDSAKQLKFENDTSDTAL